MGQPRFGITDDGDVFLLNGGFRKLGHIASLAVARTPIARQVQRWWSEQAACGEPLTVVEASDIGNGRRRYQIREPETATDARERGQPMAA